jgi:hypothetical protein
MSSIESLLNPVVTEKERKSVWYTHMRRMERQFHERPWEDYMHLIMPKGRCWIMHLLLAHHAGIITAVFSDQGYAGMILLAYVPPERVVQWNSMLFPSTRSLLPRSPTRLMMTSLFRDTGFDELFDDVTGGITYVYSRTRYLRNKLTKKRRITPLSADGYTVEPASQDELVPPTRPTGPLWEGCHTE